MNELKLIKREGILPRSFQLPKFVMSRLGTIHEVYGIDNDPSMAKMVCGARLVNPEVISVLSDEENEQWKIRGLKGVLSYLHAAEGLNVCHKCLHADSEALNPFLRAITYARQHLDRLNQDARERVEDSNRLDAVRQKMNDLVESAVIEAFDTPLADLNLDGVTLGGFISAVKGGKFIHRMDSAPTFSIVDGAYKENVGVTKMSMDDIQDLVDG